MILYRNISNDAIVAALTSKEVDKGDVMAAIGELVELTDRYGFCGNLWHCYLTFLLVSAENRYSLACEMRGEQSGGLGELAALDLEKIMLLFQSKPKNIADEVVKSIFDYDRANGSEIAVDPEYSLAINTLANHLAQSKDVAEFKGVISRFYGENGVGVFAFFRAFRVEEQELLPIKNTDKITMNDLVGYDIPKQKLIQNTEAFLRGDAANNCLLFGGAGTGKSSSVKALLNAYGAKGLRIIELQKHRLKHLNDIIVRVRARNYRFIIFMDDLSFEEFEIEYKYLKAVIEGGLEKKPSNMLIYATSNRRHLIKEDYSDRDSLHGFDTVQEKMSLAARFGETIFFDTPDKREFENIVRELAHREGLCMSDEQLLLAANSWEMSHFGKSGRTARQLIDHLKITSVK